MAKTRRRLPAAPARAAARRRHGAEPNAALKADLKEKLAPVAGAAELAAKPKAPAQDEPAAAPAPEVVEPAAPERMDAPTTDPRRRGLADPLSG